MDNEEALRNIDLFADLDQKAIESLAEFCEERFYRSGETVVRQGDPGIGLYILITGNVKVIIETESGEELEIAERGAGEFLGEMTILDNAPRSASLIATEDTHCILLPSWVFRARVEIYPQLAKRMLPVVLQRFRDTIKALMSRRGE